MGNFLPAKIHKRAKKYGLNREETIIIAAVINWMNGNEFTIGGIKRSIDSHYEPSLQELIDSGNGINWTTAMAEAHDRLRDVGLFKTQDRGEKPYCAGEYCKWVPTQDFLIIARNIYSDFDRIYPDFHRPWRDDAAPIFGDGNELLPHRKGVLTARTKLGKLNWINDFVIYPVEDGVSPDLISKRDDFHGQNGRVEVITENNDPERWIQKWATWVLTDYPTIWIFETRSVMVDFFNKIIEYEDFQGTEKALILDRGKFTGDKNNWSAQKVNQRLKRSRDHPDYYVPCNDLACTLTSFFQASSKTVGDWCREYQVFEENRGKYWVVKAGVQDS